MFDNLKGHFLFFQIKNQSSESVNKHKINPFITLFLEVAWKNNNLIEDYKENCTQIFAKKLN